MSEKSEPSVACTPPLELSPPQLSLSLILFYPSPPPSPPPLKTSRCQILNRAQIQNPALAPVTTLFYHGRPPPSAAAALRPFPRRRTCCVAVREAAGRSQYLQLAAETRRHAPCAFENPRTRRFIVIACADSRVCPSNILRFQSGEAFTVRNVANLVPPFQHGASETSAALEFAVNSLEVANILVVGHSRCGGIRALMSMKDEAESSRSFIGDWVSIAKSARSSTKAAAGNLSFEKQCSHCEKESINGSLLNLLTYPWIE